MLLDLADLPIFLAVAQAGSFVKASKRTRTPPSTTSRAVARLERQLGVRLLERTSRRVALTTAGAELVARASPIANELQAVVAEVSARDGEPSGPVRISAPLWSGAGRIASALFAFATKYRRVRIDLQLSNTVVDLVGDGFDLALRAGPVRDKSVVARKLWDVPFALAASRGFVRRELAGKRVLASSRLESAPVIVSGPSVWAFRATNGTIGSVTPTPRMHTNDPRVAIEAAKRGLGIIRVPAEAIADAGLVALRCELGELEPRPMFAVFRSRELLPHRVRLVLDWLARAEP